MIGHGKEVFLPKKRRVSKKGGTKIQPSWHYTQGHIVNFGLGGHGAPPSWQLFLGLIRQLTHNTHWTQFISWPTIQGKFSWVNSSGGLGQPTVPVLKKIGVAGPPFMGQITHWPINRHHLLWPVCMVGALSVGGWFLLTALRVERTECIKQARLSLFFLI